jgi:radical SAM protein with 4Fe4S-binding SPASM domain
MILDKSNLRVDDFLKHMLDRKIPESSEIQLILFQQCNLRCSFCGQDHENPQGIDLITQKSREIINFMRDNFRKSHIVNMMGGELFSDDMPDRVFSDYEILIKEISLFAKSTNQKVIFNFATNLVFKKNSRVLDLIKRIKTQDIECYISTSYDFSGRHSKLWFEQIYKDNIVFFKDYIRTINCVLTKPAIAKFTTVVDPYFDFLYENFSVFFEYYQPEANPEVLMPSDKEILDAFLFLAKKYPKVSPIRELIENTQNRMTCYGLNSMTLLPEGNITRCRYMPHAEGSFKNEVDFKSNSNITNAFLSENECLSCEWFDRCSFRCFVQADWSKRKAEAKCIFKTFFNEVIN